MLFSLTELPVLGLNSFHKNPKAQQAVLNHQKIIASSIIINNFKIHSFAKRKIFFFVSVKEKCFFQNDISRSGYFIFWI
jgi:hypothetical protein